MNPFLILYTRAGCHLCEQAEDLLALHAPSCELIDVDADEGARGLYGLRVPVLTHGGRVLLEGRIGERELITALASLP